MEQAQPPAQPPKYMTVYAIGRQKPVHPHNSIELPAQMKWDLKPITFPDGIADPNEAIAHALQERGLPVGYLDPCLLINRSTTHRQDPEHVQEPEHGQEPEQEPEQGRKPKRGRKPNPKPKEKMKFLCVCGETFNKDAKTLTRHNGTAKHKTHLAILLGLPRTTFCDLKSLYKCNSCTFHGTNPRSLKRHDCEKYKAKKEGLQADGPAEPQETEIQPGATVVEGEYVPPVENQGPVASGSGSTPANARPGEGDQQPPTAVQPGLPPSYPHSFLLNHSTSPTVFTPDQPEFGDLFPPMENIVEATVVWGTRVYPPTSYQVANPFLSYAPEASSSRVRLPEPTPQPRQVAVPSYVHHPAYPPVVPFHSVGNVGFSMPPPPPAVSRQPHQSLRQPLPQGQSQPQSYAPFHSQPQFEIPQLANANLKRKRDDASGDEELEYVSQRRVDFLWDMDIPSEPSGARHEQPEPWFFDINSSSDVLEYSAWDDLEAFFETGGAPSSLPTAPLPTTSSDTPNTSSPSAPSPSTPTSTAPTPTPTPTPDTPSSAAATPALADTPSASSSASLTPLPTPVNTPSPSADIPEEPTEEIPTPPQEDVPSKAESDRFLAALLELLQTGSVSNGAGVF